MSALVQAFPNARTVRLIEHANRPGSTKARSICWPVLEDFLGPAELAEGWSIDHPVQWHRVRLEWILGFPTLIHRHRLYSRSCVVDFANAVRMVKSVSPAVLSFRIMGDAKHASTFWPAFVASAGRLPSLKCELCFFNDNPDISTELDQWMWKKSCQFWHRCQC